MSQAKIKQMRQVAKAMLKEITKEMHVHYIARRPSKLRDGWVLAHNHVRHTADMTSGRNGFRFWWFTKLVPQEFKPCHCGWGKLPHVSASPNYKCEPEEVIAAFD